MSRWLGKHLWAVSGGVSPKFQWPPILGGCEFGGGGACGRRQKGPGQNTRDDAAKAPFALPFANLRNGDAESSGTAEDWRARNCSDTQRKREESWAGGGGSWDGVDVLLELGCVSASCHSARAWAMGQLAGDAGARSAPGHIFRGCRLTKEH